MTTENQAVNKDALVGGLTLTDVARECYIIDTVVDAYGSGAVGPGTIPDPNAFDQAPQDRREIIIAGVRKVLDTPNLTPEQAHTHWLELMKAKGWTRGPKTDVGRKQHALLVPYNELSQADQIKSVFFIATVRGLMGGKTGGGSLRTER
jgi:hypothetical protein